MKITENILQSDKIRVLGRYIEKDGAVALDWSNSGITFTFEGTGFWLSYGEYVSPTPAYVKVFVDGIQQRFPVTNGSEVTAIDTLDEGTHTATVLKITEGVEKLLMKELTIIGAEPKLLEPRAPKPRKIEVLGDSITCGYGILAEPTVPTYRTFEQDSTKAYAYLTAEAFDADIHSECISGQGIVCNCDGKVDYEIPKFFMHASRTKEKWDHSAWTPDVVVINAGTNDTGGGIADALITESAINFILSVRGRYPKAKIVWFYGMMLNNYINAIESAVKTVNLVDKDVYFLATDTIFGKEGEIGANNHPNMVAHRRAADELVAKIAEITGWGKV